MAYNLHSVRSEIVHARDALTRVLDGIDSQGDEAIFSEYAFRQLINGVCYALPVYLAAQDDLLKRNVQFDELAEFHHEFEKFILDAMQKATFRMVDAPLEVRLIKEG